MPLTPTRRRDAWANLDFLPEVRERISDRPSRSTRPSKWLIARGRDREEDASRSSLHTTVNFLATWPCSAQPDKLRHLERTRGHATLTLFYLNRLPRYLESCFGISFAVSYHSIILSLIREIVAKVLIGTWCWVSGVDDCILHTHPGPFIQRFGLKTLVQNSHHYKNPNSHYII